MVTQILNFGIPAQINVRTVGYDRTKNLRIAKELQQRIAAIPGVADAHLQQEVNSPEFFAQIDRARAAQFGLTVNDIALNLNTSLSSSEQVSPNFWTDPSNGTPYYITVQTPEYRVASMNDLKNTPVDQVHRVPTEIRCRDCSATSPRSRATAIPTNTNQANIQPVYEVYANADGRDLGSISGDIYKIVAEYQHAIVARQSDRGHRPDRQHERRLPRPGHRHPVRRGIRLSADGGELSELGRSVRRHPGVAGDILRHCHDAVYYRDDIERALADGRDHGHRRGVGEFDPARDLCARAAACRRCRPSMRRSPPAAPVSGRC